MRNEIKNTVEEIIFIKPPSLVSTLQDTNSFNNDVSRYLITASLTQIGVNLLDSYYVKNLQSLLP